MAEDGNAEPETLRVQLAELNSRSRWYAAQLWHVPFVYLAVIGVALAQLDDATKLAIALLASGIVGIGVSLHMYGMRDGNKRAVCNIRAVEKQLGLNITAKWKPGSYITPLQVIVALAALIFLVIGSVLFFVS